MVAVPAALTVTVPSVVVPSVKVTFPVMVAEPAASFTVAVRATGAPAMPGLGEAVTVVVVSAAATTCVMAGEVVAP
jgi:hypothetical protein